MYESIAFCNCVIFYMMMFIIFIFVFFFQAEDGIRDWSVTGVQTCALPICSLAIWLTEGNSFRQSGHQVAQKNSMTTLPRRSERWTSLPLRSGSVNAGAGLGGS